MTEVTTEAVVTAEKRKPGRPAVADSKRQAKMAERAAKEAAGETVKRGRPSNPESKNARKHAERLAKLEAGEVIKPGRPKQTKAEAEVTSSPVEETVAVEA